MNHILNKRFIRILICILILCSINIFASSKTMENNTKATSSAIVLDDMTDDYYADDQYPYEYQSYEDIMKKGYLLDEALPLEERVYSEYNIPFHIFEELSKRVIMSMYSTDFSLSDMVKLYEGMGYAKTAGFIKALDSISTDKINAPDFKSNECYIHNGKYETRTVLIFPNGDTATVNLAYDKTIPYLYYADNIEFYTGGLSFDMVDKSMRVLDDYCVTKGENLSQYADMDEFIRNFVLAILGILAVIIIVTYINKKSNADNKSMVVQTDNKAVPTNDTALVAVLTAAIAAYEGTTANNIRIKTIRKNIRWKNI